MKQILACMLATWGVAGNLHGADIPLVKAASTFSAFEIVNGVPAKSRVAIPASAVSLWAGELRPHSLHEQDGKLLVTYDCTSALFDLETGKVIERDLAPSNSSAMSELRPLWKPPVTIGPGVLAPGGDRKAGVAQAVASVKFRGRNWTSVQTSVDLGPEPPRTWGNRAWTRALGELNEHAYLEATSLENADKRRYTIQDGLASNLVNLLAVADDTLWAACVDIYDHETDDWGPGGLCRWDTDKEKWVRQTHVNGLPVRFVTMLQSAGKDLWVGFRLGGGIEGDVIHQALGTYAGDYGPFVDRIAVARLSDGRWTTHLCQPLHSKKGPGAFRAEAPRAVWPTGGRWLLLTTVAGEWYDELDRRYVYHFRTIDLNSREPDVIKTADIEHATRQSAPLLTKAGQLVVAAASRTKSTSGAYLWAPADGDRGKWNLLDPNTRLPIGRVLTAAVVNDQIWLGGLGCAQFDSLRRDWPWDHWNEIGTRQPVSQIEQTADGRVFLLFRARSMEINFAEQIGPTIDEDEEIYYGVSDRLGVAVLSGGKWTFPAPVPTYIGDQDGYEHPVAVLHMQAIGDELFIQNNAGVYAGPDKWRRVCEGATVGLTTSPDGTKLIIPRYKQAPRDWSLERFPSQEQFVPKLELGTYDPKTQQLSWEDSPTPDSSQRTYGWGELPGLHDFDAEPVNAKKPWQREFRLPVAGERQWAMSLAEHAAHSPTPAVISREDAIWLIDERFVVRLDRRQLEQALAAAK